MKEDVPKTTFKMHKGHYKYQVMPFGLMNAPATFQSLMNQIFHGLLRQFILIFFYDILVYSPSIAVHRQQLVQVFQILLDHDLQVNPKKCQFGCDQLAFLGHWISAQGVLADAIKVEAMNKWPVPKSPYLLGTVMQLNFPSDEQAMQLNFMLFLGLTRYYQQFIKNYKHKAAPLTTLNRKDAFRWSTDAQQAFDSLKNSMSSTLVLALLDFTAPFVIEKDASDIGIGAILMQKGCPIAYLSQALPPILAYERELIALVFAVQKGRHYLTHHPFVIHIDQFSLKYLLCQKQVHEPYSRWA